jgi:hypothetical protein
VTAAARRACAPASRLTALEEAELRRLVNEAVDLRDTPYYRDAVASIVDWHWRTLPDRLDRKARKA